MTQRLFFVYALLEKRMFNRCFTKLKFPNPYLVSAPETEMTDVTERGIKIKRR